MRVSVTDAVAARPGAEEIRRSRRNLHQHRLRAGRFAQAGGRQAEARNPHGAGRDTRAAAGRARVGAQFGDDPEVAALAEATRLETLAKQIDETQKEEDAAERETSVAG